MTSVKDRFMSKMAAKEPQIPRMHPMDLMYELMQIQGAIHSIIKEKLPVPDELLVDIEKIERYYNFYHPGEWGGGGMYDDNIQKSIKKLYRYMKDEPWNNGHSMI